MMRSFLLCLAFWTSLSGTRISQGVAGEPISPGTWQPRQAADRVWLEHANHPDRPALYGWNHLSPRLTTPQWVGVEGVEAVVILAIDDMRESARYEAFLRPILQRLKQIDGRAPVSIMTCRATPEDPQLQSWLDEGLSLECHTIDHPCPLLKDGDFLKAASTYWDCIDLLARVPGNHPVAFRMPCCDSLNTVSPRAMSEIIGRPSGDGFLLQIDSSVFNVFNDRDPDLPSDLVFDAQGRPRFEKYLPRDRMFVNTIENYPYPYLVSRHCWEFPCLAPSDWSAQHFHGNANPDTLEDWKAAVDLTVIKQGVLCLVFHPYDWSTPEMFVELIDYVEQHHGHRVKFLTFREALFALQEHALAVELSATKPASEVRLVDLTLNGTFDILVESPGKPAVSRVWNPEAQLWDVIPLPTLAGEPLRLDDIVLATLPDPRDPACRRATLCLHTSDLAWQFAEGAWHHVTSAAPTGSENGPADWEFEFVDVDGDGISECLAWGPQGTGPYKYRLGRFSVSENQWLWQTCELPIAIDTRHLVDVDEDGCLDLILPATSSSVLRLFRGFDAPWSVDDTKVDLPAFSFPDQTHAGFFVHSRHLIWQNEDTAGLPDLIDRRTYDELLAGLQPGSRDPLVSLYLIETRPGMVVELVAAEPLVLDPVAFDWGADGRLWVVEMADYPRGIDDDGRPGGRVRFLEDTNGDGQYDTSTVFLEGLPIPTGVMAWQQGVLITAAPDILYAEDTSGDGRADVVVPLYSGFVEGNPQHRVGGLVWGIDNWIYCANGDSDGIIVSLAHRDRVNIQGRDFRIRPATGEIQTQSGRTQFGRTTSDYGDWFGCNNANPCFHFVLDEHYLARNPALAPPSPLVQVPEIPGAAPCYPISRLLERFNDFHMENLFTSACGLHLYRDSHLGADFEGNVFVCEPVHNLVNRQIVSARGVTFQGVRADDERDREFLASRDNWFRPTLARTGPDGALWISDMYRHVIEHPQWIPEEWQARLDLRAGDDRGRIYRVFHRDRPPREIPRLQKMSTVELVAALDSSNGWQRDTAQRLLLERQDRTAVEPLVTLAGSCERPQTRAQALWTLEGLHALDFSTVQQSLADPHPGVRRQAIRLSERFLSDPAFDSSALTETLQELSRDEDLLVRMQVAYSLGSSPDDRFAETLGNLLFENRRNEYLLAAGISSLHVENVEPVLVHLLEREAAVEADPNDDGLHDGPLVSGRLLGIASRLGRRGIVREMLQSYLQIDPESPAASLRKLAGVLQLADADAVLRRNDSQELRNQLDKVLELAARFAVSAVDDEATRLAAIHLLRYSRNSRVVSSLSGLLTARESLPVQKGVLETLSRITELEAVTALLDVQRQTSPTLQGLLLDAVLDHPQGARLLLDRLERGDVQVTELSPVHQQRLLLHPEPGLRSRAERLLARSGSSRQETLEQYRPTLDLEGHVEAGRELFRKTCSACHRAEEHGHEVGPDLAALKDRSWLSLLIAILDPNHSVEAKYLVYTAADQDGRIHSGWIESETANSITLLAAEGKRVTLLRADLESLVNTGKSAMPDGLEKDLSVQDMANLLSYVEQIGGRPPRKIFPGNTPRTLAPDANGLFVLRPDSAEIYGPSLILEDPYRNLGYWSSPDDHAIWTLDLPEPGNYLVEIEYACPGSVAGNRLRLSCGDRQLIYLVEGTGSWDQYRRVAVGRWQLPAGRLQLVAEGLEPIQGALLDLIEIRLRPE